MISTPSMACTLFGTPSAASRRGRIVSARPSSAERMSTSPGVATRCRRASRRRDLRRILRYPLGGNPPRSTRASGVVPGARHVRGLSHHVAAGLPGREKLVRRRRRVRPGPHDHPRRLGPGRRRFRVATMTQVQQQRRRWPRINLRRFMRCRRQAPTGRHANPTLVGGSDDEAARTNRCGQERLRAGGPAFGVVHVPQGNSSSRSVLQVVPPRSPGPLDPGEEIARGRAAGHQSEVVVHDDGQIEIEGHDLTLVIWNHDPARLRSALGYRARVVWKPRYHVLNVSATYSAWQIWPNKRRACRRSRRLPS